MQFLSLLFVSALALSSSAFQHGIGKNRCQSMVKASSANAATTPATTVATTVTQSVRQSMVKVSTTSAAPTPATTAVAPAVTQSDAFADQAVAQHNAARAKYGANPITWNAALYSATQAYANQCKFQHSSGGNYGENLAAGTGKYGIVDAVNGWMSEASAYDYNKPDFSSATGHFTQVVWKGTTQVACAVASCPAGTIFSQASQYVVCRYTPPGNFLGQFAANVGRPV